MGTKFSELRRDDALARLGNFYVGEIDDETSKRTTSQHEAKLGHNEANARDESDDSGDHVERRIFQHQLVH